MKRTLFLVAIGMLIFVGCKKPRIDLVPNSGYLVPVTYSFDNVSFSGQQYRIEMLEELAEAMEAGNTPGTTVDANVLRDMYANRNNRFSTSELNSCGKQLQNKTYGPDTSWVLSMLDSHAMASLSTTPGSNGVAGVVTSTSNPTRKYLFNARGFEYTELVEKALMGAVFYYQAVAFYLENLPLDDNTTVVPGEGTDMEHHMDEAFGYFGVPVNFPIQTTGLQFFGKYCNLRNAILGTNSRIMTAFLKCRAAISNKDYVTRNAQVIIIRETWEQVIAASCISYLNSAKANFSDDAIRNHALSEYAGFVHCLKYNPYKRITNTQIDQALAYIGNNLYLVSMSDIDSARDLISGIYGLDAVKTSL